MKYIRYDHTFSCDNAIAMLRECTVCGTTVRRDSNPKYCSECGHKFEPIPEKLTAGDFVAVLNIMRERGCLGKAPKRSSDDTEEVD